MRFAWKGTSNTAEQLYNRGYYKVGLIGFVDDDELHFILISFSFCVL